MEIPTVYRQRISQLYPNNKFNTLGFNQEGMVNDVVILDNQIVCRFPKHDWATEMLQHEAKVLDLVRDYVDVRVPKFEVLEADVATYQFIKGTPLTRLMLFSLPARERQRMMVELGAFLKQLHTIPLGEAEAKNISASDTNRGTKDWESLYLEVETLLFPYLMRHQKTAIEVHFSPILTGELEMSYKPTLMNGDLGPYHVLFDTKAITLAGIIDFGTAGIGDPATDFAVMLNEYGEALVSFMEPSYPNMSEHLDRARFWAGTLELQWALAGIKTNNKELLFAHLGGTRDRLPFGAKC